MTTKLCRIVLALEDPEHLQPTLGDAAMLAAHLHGELRGVLIEDEDLRQLAGLPFAIEFAKTSGIPRALDAERLERQLRLRAERIRRAFQRIESEERLHTSVQIVRGRLQVHNIATEQSADVVFIACRRRAMAPADNGRLVAARTRAPLAVFYDLSPAAGRALEVAAALHRGSSSPLLVLVGERFAQGKGTGGKEDLDALSAGLSGTEFRVLELQGSESPEVAAIRHRCRLLIIPALGTPGGPPGGKTTEAVGLPLAVVA